MHNREIKVGDRLIGDGHPVFVIGEIGINHNGNIDIAKKIILGAKRAGCDAVKFQKRTRKFVPLKINGILSAILPGVE